MVQLFNTAIFVWVGIELLLIALALITLGLARVSYRAEGAPASDRCDSRLPSGPATRWLARLSARVLDALLAATRRVLDTLFETSAEVGDWFIRHQPEVVTAFRSRFL